MSLMTLTSDFVHHNTTNPMCQVNPGNVGPTTAEYRFAATTGTPHQASANGKRRSGPTLHKKKRSYDLRDDFQTAGFAAGHHRGSSEVVGAAHSARERSPPLSPSDTGHGNIPRPRL